MYPPRQDPCDGAVAIDALVVLAFLLRDHEVLGVSDPATVNSWGLKANRVRSGDAWELPRFTSQTSILFVSTGPIAKDSTNLIGGRRECFNRRTAALKCFVDT